MSEQDLEQIIAGEVPAEPEPVAEAAPEPQVEPTPEPEPAPEPEAPKEQTVPLATFLGLRDEMQKLKAQLPQAEPPKAPDVLDDQQGYTEFLQSEVQKATQNVRLDMSEAMARQQHGDAVVDEAFQALQAGAQPAEVQAIMSSSSPWSAVVSWHQQKQAAAEIGNDPTAYKAKVEAELRAKIQAEMVAEAAKEKASKSAPSLANVTGSGGGPVSTWNGPTPLDQIV